MGLLESYTGRANIFDSNIAKMLESSLFEHIQYLTESGAFSKNPTLEESIDRWLSFATHNLLQPAFYNENYHPHLIALRSFINKNELPFNEIREKAITAIKNAQYKAAEHTLELNRQYHFTQTTEDLGVFADNEGRYMQSYSIATDTSVSSGFGPFCAYYETKFMMAGFNDDEEVIYKNVATHEQVAPLSRKLIAALTNSSSNKHFIQLAQMNLRGGEIVWHLDSKRQAFCEQHNISVVIPHKDGCVAIGLQHPEEIFDFIYMLYNDNPASKLFVDTAKKL